MEHNTIKSFDKEEIFETKIKPLLQEITSICSANDIPMFFSACVKETGTNSEYKNECVSPQSHGMNLSNDHFSDYIGVTLGFNTIPPFDRPDFDYDADNE